MSMTSVSLSCAIRPARSGGSSGGGAPCAAAGWRGGFQNTFGAGAVPATPRTPGVPQPSSTAAAATPRVTGRNVRAAATLQAGTARGRGAGEAREAARRRRPAADPPRPVRVPRGGARPLGAPRPSGGGGGALRGGRRGETAARASRRAAAGGPVAPVRGEGPADEEGAPGHREAEGRVTTVDGAL